MSPQRWIAVVVGEDTALVAAGWVAQHGGFVTTSYQRPTQARNDSATDDAGSAFAP